MSIPCNAAVCENKIDEKMKSDVENKNRHLTTRIRSSRLLVLYDFGILANCG
jgi:hypothetical protein